MGVNLGETPNNNGATKKTLESKILSSEIEVNGKIIDIT